MTYEERKAARLAKVNGGKSSKVADSQYRPATIPAADSCPVCGDLLYMATVQGFKIWTCPACECDR